MLVLVVKLSNRLLSLGELSVSNADAVSDPIAVFALCCVLRIGPASLDATTSIAYWPSPLILSLAVVTGVESESLWLISTGAPKNIPE